MLAFFLRWLFKLPNFPMIISKFVLPTIPTLILYEGVVSEVILNDAGARLTLCKLAPLYYNPPAVPFVYEFAPVFEVGIYCCCLSGIDRAAKPLLEV